MGHKPVSDAIKNSLKRKKVISTRTYTLKDGATSRHIALIESFTKTDFETYDYYYHKWGSSGNKRPALVKAMEDRQVSGPPLELAKLRLVNGYDHQKVWQSIRYRWTDIYSYNKAQVNSNTDAVWVRLARGVFTRMKDFPRMHSTEWGSTKEEVIESLVKCFKQKFETQNQLCAISKVQMKLAIGIEVENKCSIDRIDSSKPYTKKNIQLVAYWANVMKLDASSDQFLARINLIYHANFA